MNDWKADERKSTELEAKARAELLRRLEHPLKLLRIASDKEQAKRRERVEQLREYQTVDEIQDAYGYERITDEERTALIEALEAGDEYIENKATTATEIAFGLLREFTGRLTRERQSLEFDLLPKEKQIQIMQESEERQKAAEARKRARAGEEAAP